ncbi:hypothetical protein Gorai_021053 [Gossypium raimondii]|uniref:RNase H type-1 domain-containing protein n=1 Tax=Gossypium raimondii TaxID=29730 RepID=A0A7J8NP63_GOSRA|nr:hypothetical protein [Gossypium raimondii]
MGHNDSFCEAKMMVGVEIAEMGWDLSIRAQSPRALTMKSVWLREEWEGDSDGFQKENRKFMSEPRGMEEKKSFVKIIDPVLGINLDGGLSRAAANQASSLTSNDQQAMEHDLEDTALVDRWIPGIEPSTWQNGNENRELKTVSNLIDGTSKQWKTEIIFSTFQEDIAQKILKIPLAETDSEDLRVWKGEATGEFSVRSAYKLLQEDVLSPNNLLQTELKEFYRKLWNIQLPSKILLLIWQIFWNYMPTLVNLRNKRITTIVRCPRYGSGEEDSSHVFRQCPTSIEVWQNISMGWVTIFSDQNIRTWLTWVFAKGRILAQKIESFIAELEGVGKEKHTRGTDRLQKHSEEEPRDTILFDAAFEANRYRSALGVIVRNRRGEMKVLKTTLHSNVSSPFLAEALACLQAVKLGISLGLRSATIRGDSKTVIAKCQSAERDKSSIGAVINDIKSHSLLFHEVSFQYIQKSENYQAHKIAKETLANENERYLVRDESIHNEGVTKEEWPRNPD